LKQRVGGEVGSEHGSATTGDSGRGPSEDSAAPPTDDGIAVASCVCFVDLYIDDTRHVAKGPGLPLKLFFAPPKKSNEHRFQQHLFYDMHSDVSSSPQISSFAP